MKKYLAEFIGTFTLVFVSCGAAAVSGGIGGVLGVLGIAAAFGLSIVAMAYSIGTVSGCHINPAVSLAMLISKKLSVKDFVGYIVAQFIGATVAAGVLKFIISTSGKNIQDIGLGCDGYGAASFLGINATGAIVVEIILTFIFVLAILGVTSSEKTSSVAGLVIGASLTFVHIVGIPLTGTSVNPARSFGPALMLGGEKGALAMAQLPVFIIAPLIGGALAAFVWKALTCNND